MKALAIAALMSLSTVSFANDIGAAIKMNPVVAGAIQGVEKQYGMKCEQPKDIKSDKESNVSATISCLGSEEIDGEVFESAVIMQIKAYSFEDGLMINNISFTFAG